MPGVFGTSRRISPADTRDLAAIDIPSRISGGSTLHKYGVEPHKGAARQGSHLLIPIAMDIEGKSFETT